MVSWTLQSRLRCLDNWASRPFPRHKSHPAVYQIPVLENVGHTILLFLALLAYYFVPEFFTGLLQSHPIVPTSSTPIYSNAAYQLLGYAVEAMAGTDYQDFLSRKVLSPLGMTRTFYNTPNMSLGVIPNSGGQQWWNFAMGDETP